MDLLDIARSSVAFIFPGQGTQYVGMGRELYDSSPAARAIFAEADETLGFSLSRLCFEGPEDELRDTVNAQPAILTVSIACLAALRERWEALGRLVTPLFVAGHSLGEYTALVAAGVLDFADALRLVRERGRLMKEAGEHQPGGMAAIIGLSEERVVEVCRQAEAEGTIAMANANSPAQVVLSGEVRALERAMDLAREFGARKVERLSITIASHSPLMQRAAQQFAELLNHVRLRDPQVPVVANITGRALTTAEEIKAELAEHLIGPVRWSQSVGEMINNGVETFVEIGPGAVLSGLVRRITRDVQAIPSLHLPILANPQSQPTGAN
ncbi:MAG: ACP S-malonyltransferase [Chloroflexi bacterium]|nr:ACP S-malonyltransferase [Chloroflexota bacterium]MBI4507330.1 ACP S-malonyltransferase [Chloroflexota bacterium]